MNAQLNLVRGQAMTLELETPKPKLDGVLRIQGYKDPDKVRPVIRNLATAAVDTFISKTVPTVTYRVVDVQAVNGEGAVLGDDVHLQSEIFQQYLNQSVEAVVFVLTVGKAIDEQTIEWMNEEKLIEALFLESAAWLGVENATKQFVLMVRQWAMQQSMRMSRRLGPGYSYPINGRQVTWDLTDQKPLFELVDDPAMPVILLESAAMLPKMSRSGLFGLIPNNIPRQ